ncbi:MAG: hypothetical protein ABIT82_07040 [Ramlibacter sp.]
MNQRRSFNKRLLAATMFPSVILSARADAVGYAAVYDCKAETDLIIAHHHHDWSAATRAARWKMISTDKDPFSPQNSYSFLRVTDRRTKVQKFQVPVPALAYLWISADSRFVVGVSDIKLWNPVQLVVFNSEGVLLLAKRVDSSSFPGVSESVTNSVNWYRTPVPGISIEGAERSYTLRIEGNTGERRVFRFNGPA